MIRLMFALSDNLQIRGTLRAGHLIQGFSPRA
jgi:hypothetical protein